MNEMLDSQLSAMFDDELPAAECELLARRLSRDEALREIARRAVQRLRRMPDPARHRQAGEETDGAEEIFQLAAQHQIFSDTPADSKLAMSFRKLNAARTSG